MSNITNFNLYLTRKGFLSVEDKKPTKVLIFIHGGKERSLYGAWDYVSSTADNQTIDKLISGLKHGKYLQ